MTNAGRGLALLMLCALAACGEDSDDDGEDGGRFDEPEARSDGLLNEVEDLSLTDPASLPTMGAAAYGGVVGLNLEAVPAGTLQGYDMEGEPGMTVNFAGAGGQVTGTADRFVGVGGEEFDGVLIVDEGRLGRGADPGTEYTYGAGMAGEITGEDGAGWIVDTSLQGDFAGEDHSHAFGDVNGAACSDAGCGGAVGGFVAER